MTAEVVLGGDGEYVKLLASSRIFRDVFDSGTDNLEATALEGARMDRESKRFRCSWHFIKPSGGI
jgi:hypothetical protein